MSIVMAYQQMEILVSKIDIINIVMTSKQEKIESKRVKLVDK